MKWGTGRGLELNDDIVQIIFAVLATIIIKRMTSSGLGCYRQRQEQHQQQRHAKGHSKFDDDEPGDLQADGC